MGYNIAIYSMFKKLTDQINNIQIVFNRISLKQLFSKLFDSHKKIKNIQLKEKCHVLQEKVVSIHYIHNENQQLLNQLEKKLKEKLRKN